MEKSLVKICGITLEETLEDIKKEQVAIDWLGFIFAYGKRLISPERWQELSLHIPPHVKRVGVFVDPTLEDIRRIFAEAPLHIVQLHGQETPEFCLQVKEEFSCQVMKVIGVDEDGKANLELVPYQGAVDFFLLDTVTKNQAGGTGKTFSWEAIPLLQQQCRSYGIPLLVAGGLNAENVAELLTTYKPFGIDLSSGVETDGKKDLNKIRKVIQVTERMKDCGRNNQQ